MSIIWFACSRKLAAVTELNRVASCRHDSVGCYDSRIFTDSIKFRRKITDVNNSKNYWNLFRSFLALSGSPEPNFYAAAAGPRLAKRFGQFSAISRRFGCTKNSLFYNVWLFLRKENGKERFVIDDAQVGGKIQQFSAANLNFESPLQITQN